MSVCKQFQNERRLAVCGARGDPCENNGPVEQIYGFAEGRYPTAQRLSTLPPYLTAAHDYYFVVVKHNHRAQRNAADPRAVH